MRIVFAVILVPGLLLGCTRPAQIDASAACVAQGHRPGTEAHWACMNAGGAQIATGPGSPYANADEEEGL